MGMVVGPPLRPATRGVSGEPARCWLPIRVTGGTRGPPPAALGSALGPRARPGTRGGWQRGEGPALKPSFYFLKGLLFLEKNTVLSWNRASKPQKWEFWGVSKEKKEKRISLTLSTPQGHLWEEPWPRGCPDPKPRRCLTGCSEGQMAE